VSDIRKLIGKDLRGRWPSARNFQDESNSLPLAGCDRGDHPGDGFGPGTAFAEKRLALVVAIRLYERFEAAESLRRTPIRPQIVFVDAGFDYCRRLIDVGNRVSRGSRNSENDADQADIAVSIMPGRPRDHSCNNVRSFQSDARLASDRDARRAIPLERLVSVSRRREAARPSDHPRCLPRQSVCRK